MTESEAKLPFPSNSMPRRKRRLRRLLSAGVLLALWSLIALGFVLGYFALTLPDIGNLAITRRPSVTIAAADNTVLATSGDFFGDPYQVADLPSYVPQAVVAIEDRRFYHHFGIDPVGLVRAAYRNWRAGHLVQGGSTITQQLAKNLFLKPERSFRRKIQEMLLALWLEHNYSKNQILSIYLNRVYLGAGVYGIDAAAGHYFHVHADQLTLPEAAMIAAMLKAPVRYNPAIAPARAFDRAKLVLAAMRETGAITAADADAAVLPTAKPTPPSPRIGAYFTDWILDRLNGTVAEDRDLVVHTTLDPALQQIAEKEAAAMVAAEGEKRDFSQVAVLVMTPDGAVKAMVGGAGYADSQFNRATQALRQPGSAFKLFVYLAALEAGMSPETLVLDAPITIAHWTPHNYDHRYHGEVTLREAFAKSINTVAVRLIEAVKPKQVIKVARRLGITTKLPNDATLALGSGEVTPIELTSAFATIANGGDGVIPYGIGEITAPDGSVLWQREGSGLGRVLAPEHVLTMDSLLQEVVTSGTGRAAALSVRTAGKTGTTSDYNDAWFVGYAGGLVTAVWVGNDDNSVMKKVAGGDVPARLWRKIMAACLAKMEPEALNSTSAPINPSSEPTDSTQPTLDDLAAQKFDDTQSHP